MNGKDVNGWFVGYVETRGQVYCFAANIQGKRRRGRQQGRGNHRRHFIPAGDFIPVGFHIFRRIDDAVGNILKTAVSKGLITTSEDIALPKWRCGYTALTVSVIVIPSAFSFRKSHLRPGVLGELP